MIVKQQMLTRFVWFVLLLLLTILPQCHSHQEQQLHQQRQFSFKNNSGTVPIIINTWAFVNATQQGWKTLQNNGSALDAIVSACTKCQNDQCDHTVGWGGSPDESGETTLDAMIMDGPSHKVGAVGALRRIKNVIGVARAVLEHSEHTFLVGNQATNFAIAMGFQSENLTSEWSANQFDQWLHKDNCQPNYWLNVEPNSKKSCGPYKASNQIKLNKKRSYKVDRYNHDTIGAVAIDLMGRIASGTSTNGMNHKIPGRVGDSPIAGAGSYVDQDVGGAAATGDGDIIMRFLVSYQAVENMRQGMSAAKAAENALSRILTKFPDAQVGLVTVDMQRNYGAACINVNGGFPFSVAADSTIEATVQRVDCITDSQDQDHNSIKFVQLLSPFSFLNCILISVFNLFVYNLQFL